MGRPQSLPVIDPVTISAELLAELQSLPDARKGSTPTVWQPWMDEALLAFWPVKRQSDVAKKIGVAVQTCRHRYEELTKS